MLGIILGLVGLYIILKDISAKGTKGETGSLLKKAEEKLNELRSDQKR